MNPASGLQLGIVVAAYPQGMSVDVLLPDSGSRLTNVQVMLASGSDATGTVDLPDPGLPADDTRWNLPSNPERQIRAVIASYKGNPICIGFLLPQVCQMTFPDKNRRVFRHASDVYTSVDQFGNTELYHPSGTYLRIGTAPAHEDLTGKDFDGDWKIAKNKTTAPYVHLTVANAGVAKATLEIDPSGNITVTSQSVTVTTQGNVNINGVTIDPTGNINSPATITASTDVVGGGKHLKTHVHSGVTSGGSNTGAPV